MNKTDKLTTILLQLRANKQILAYSHEHSQQTGLHGLSIFATTPLDKHCTRMLCKRIDQVLALMDACDIRTCPAPDYHRDTWYYVPTEKRFVCAMCEQLGVK